MQANDAIDISKYIINYSNNMGYCITNLKLQKLLYLIQAYFVANNEICFKDKIIAWINAFNNTNKEITINALYKYFGE